MQLSDGTPAVLFDAREAVAQCKGVTPINPGE
jgi:hypothetical protein